jgi:serine/threonine protein kinase/Tol biopolymer transport system component
MTPEIHRQSSELFDRLQELPEAEIIPALEAACAGNVELREQVLRLIEADRAAGASFLGRRAVEDAARLVTPARLALPSAGTVIGNYSLIRQIGAGGMGVVFEAKDLHLDRRVAIKILPLSIAAEAQERIRRFQRESRAASTLNHPHIVSILDANFAQGYHYIAMEFVDGKTLRQLIGVESLDVETMLEWIGQIASALGAAHEAGIIHRDIKPENIMVRPDGFLKVLDFGLAKLHEEAPRVAPRSEILTRAGNVAGTLHYLSPEQILGEPVGPRSDLFSLGVVAYELATGVCPFEGPTDGAIFEAILHSTPPEPATLRPDFGIGLSGLIMRAIEKDPQRRFQTAADLRAACRSVSRSYIVQGPAPESAPPVPAVLSRAQTARSIVGFKPLIAFAFVLLLAVCIWLFLSLRRQNLIKNAPGPAQVTLLTALPGYQIHPSLSPDGRRLAFVWNGHGNNYDIYVKAVDSEDAPRRLTSNEAQDLSPAWSPDGTQIAFLRITPLSKQILVIPAAGGPERLIGEIKPVSVPWKGEPSTMRALPGPAWSPAGQTLAVSDRCDAGGISDCIFLLSLDGTRRRFTTGAVIGDYNAVFSPDGKQIAFLRTTGDIGTADIFTQSLNESSAHRLTADNKVSITLAWSGNHRIYFISNRTGPLLAWSAPDTGGDPQLVPGLTGAAIFLSAAAHSSEIAYAESYRNSNIWRTNLTARGAAPQMLIGSSRSNYSAQYSPDGAQIVFISDRTGGSEIWVAKSDGSDPRRITFSASVRPIGSPTWSPDGKQFVYDAVLGGRSQVYLTNVDGTNQRQFTSDSWESMMPAWSADGRSLYYVVRRNGLLSLWKRPVAGGAVIQIANDVTSEALESPDGETGVFLADRARNLGGPVGRWIAKPGPAVIRSGRQPPFLHHPHGNLFPGARVAALGHSPPGFCDAQGVHDCQSAEDAGVLHAQPFHLPGRPLDAAFSGGPDRQPDIPDCQSPVRLPQPAERSPLIFWFS